MQVKALIEILQGLKPEAEVLAYDSSEQDILPVTGYVHGEGDDIILSTETED